MKGFSSILSEFCASNIFVYKDEHSYQLTVSLQDQSVGFIRGSAAVFKINIRTSVESLAIENMIVAGDPARQ